MRQRINGFQHGPNAYKSLFAVGSYLGKCTIEKHLLDLVFFRVSQINGCAYCLDMHAKDLRANGETEQRLYVLDAWREAPFYSDRERAALAWAEAVTRIANGDVPDEVYNEAITQFDEPELVDLTLAVNTINTWNRFNIAFRTTAGSYKVGEHAVKA
jgi:AhpD family alkylhydroperoxidase